MAAPPVTYRPLGPFDLDLLARMHGECFDSGWDRPWNAQSFAEVLAMPGASGLLALAGEQPVGFGLTLTPLDEVELLLLAILPDWRHQGQAGRLLAELLRRAAKQGAMRALLEVAAPNKAAIACYEAAGFTPCGRRQNYYAGRIDAVIFEKSLEFFNITGEAH